MPPEDADLMEKSEDPDRVAPEGAYEEQSDLDLHCVQTYLSKSMYLKFYCSIIYYCQLLLALSAPHHPSY